MKNTDIRLKFGLRLSEKKVLFENYLSNADIKLMNIISLFSEMKIPWSKGFDFSEKKKQ